MARRSSRHLELYGSEREKFMRAATVLHGALQDICRELTTSGEDYKALSALSQSVCEAITQVTGDAPPWAQSAAASSNGPRSA